MLFAYTLKGTALERTTVENGAIPDNAVWVDMVTPTGNDEKLVEKIFNIGVPTREEMAEIEPSSRLYAENGARYMTASLIYDADTDHPKLAVITFILSNSKLITVRYDEPRPFARVATKLGRQCPTSITGEAVLIELLDAIIDRAADILERVGAEVDAVSRKIFEGRAAKDSPGQRYQVSLRAVGRKADLTSKMRESLGSIGRLILFFINDAQQSAKLPKEQYSQIRGMSRDVTSLTDYAAFLINKLQFLLDAIVGMVSLEQNNIIKIFSVMAVALMPPTLIASIYGMNFKHMPELDWTFGYPLAILVMITAAVAPYLYFKWKKWL
jgi:magnesium transporter